ncbi:MAG: hypothetical protein E7Z74_05275 [Methanobrevibacter millerae]|uniref:Uncharacterized protein n=1 Tax=Methanobrevibacter millerae TaxID=230361 RepID=A0A8T3VMT2_9EURY|nr:hypothetical protein [Methanobrevibacter millerae]
MNAKQIMAIIIPIAIFMFRRYISILITLPILIIGCIVTYYFYTKSKEDKYLRVALSLYGLNFFFIFIGFLLVFFF